MSPGARVVRTDEWWARYRRLERELGNAFSEGDSAAARRLTKALADMFEASRS